MFEITHRLVETFHLHCSYDRDGDPLFDEKLERLIYEIPWLSAAELEDALEDYEGDYSFVKNLYL